MSHFQRPSVLIFTLLLVVSCTGAKVNETSRSAAGFPSTNDPTLTSLSDTTNFISNTVSSKPLSSGNLIVATTPDVSRTQAESNLSGMTSSSLTATIQHVHTGSTPLTTSNMSPSTTRSERIAKSETTQSFLNQHSTSSKLMSSLRAQSVQPTRTKAFTKSIEPTRTVSFTQDIFPPSKLSSISIIANSIPTRTSSTFLRTSNLPQATPTPAVTSSPVLLSIKATPTTITGGTPADTPTPYLLFANRDTIRRVDLDGTGIRTVVGNSSFLQNAIGVDYDIRHNHLLWTDVRSQQILMADLMGDNVTVLVDSGLTVPDGLAWDWINTKAYWSDTEHREIEVLDPYTGHRRRLVHTGPNTVPRGVAVDPVITRYIYWTDWGDVAKIERISMDGAPSTRQVLHNTDLIWPNDLTIDFTTQTLYWVDANLDKIESSNLDGTNRTLLTQSLILHPFSITVFSGMLYWSDWAVNLILHTSLFDLHRVTALIPRLETEPMGLKVVHHTRQPLGSTVNPCLLANGNCTHLCLLSSSHLAGYTCSCPEGLSLSNNGRSCFSSTTEVPLTTTALEGSCVAAGLTECCQEGSCLGSPPTCFCDAFCSETDSCCSDITSLCQPDYLVFANRRFIHRLELDTFSLTTLYTDTNKNFVGFDYDYRRGFLYWSDLSSNSIFRSTLRGDAVTVIVNGTLSIPDDVAVDWLSNLLYWTEAGTSTISVYNLERGHLLTLFSLPDSSVPRGIAVDPMEGYMFWTDWGTPAKVERASMDGTGRTTIIDTSLRWPNGITIDYDSKLLYWVDAGLDKIESSRYDGSDRHVILSIGVHHPFSITFFKGTLYWTDWLVDSVFSSSVQSNVSSVVYSRLTVDPMGIQAISPTRQKFNTVLCGPDNSNCDHLCLLNNNGTTTCACADGYMLANNGRDCIVLPTTVPPTTLPHGGSCVRAGFTECCTNGTCEGLPRGCFCDRFCVSFLDCCDDVVEICPELRPKVSTTTISIGSSSIPMTTVHFTTSSLTPAQLTPTPKDTQAMTDLTVNVGAAVGGVIIVVLVVIFVILIVLLVVMKRRISNKYAIFNNPPDRTIGSVSSGLIYQNPVAINTDIVIAIKA